MQSRQTSAPGCCLSQANLSTQEMKAETTPPPPLGSYPLDTPVGSQNRMFSEHRHPPCNQPHLSPRCSARRSCSAWPCLTRQISHFCTQNSHSKLLWTRGLTLMCKPSKEDFLFWLSRDSGWQASIHPDNFNDQFKQREGLKLYKPTRLPE